MIKLRVPLPKDFPNRDVEFVLPLVSKDQSTELTPEILSAIGAALIEMLPKEDFTTSGSSCLNTQERPWSLAARLSSIERTP